MTRRIGTLISMAETTVVQIDPEEVRVPAEGMHGQIGVEDTGATGSARSLGGDPRKGEPKVFWEAIVRISSNGLRLPIQLFMARSDEYPRFVWQNYLLSFQACLRAKESQNGDQETFGRYGPQHFSLIIDFYPDILQRELLRDSFELADQGPKKIRYGALHAAVLCNRVDLVHLIRDPDEYRKKILKRLTPEVGDVSLGSFIFIRRALLWKHMHSASYGRVAAFIKEFEKVRMLKELEELKKFIESTARAIDYKDEYDPWIIMLAWSAASRQSNHILEEFKRSQPEVFKRILLTLDEFGSAFKLFFSDDLANQRVTSPKSQGQGQRVVDRELTVQSIIELLVVEAAEDEDVQERDDDDPVPLKYDYMQKYFLDRLSERTPKTRWSPLHLAAADGKHEMVRLLISSCDKILDKLGKEVKSIYVSNIQNSFHDAKYMTPLHYAVLGNHKDIVESLMGWKLFHPHVNDRDIFMRSAFQIACSKQERKDIAAQLVASNILDVNTMDCCSYTGVHWAVLTSCTETARILIQKNKLFAYKEGLVPLIKRLEMKDSQKLLLNLSSMKNEIERLYRDRQVYVDASNAILVGAALIASVTFGGWLQPPLGNAQDLDYRKVELSVFWAFNSLSFFFATATVMSGAAAVLPVGGFDNNMEQAVESIRRWLVVTSFLLVISVMFVLVAFAAGGFSSLSVVTITNLKGNMAITTGIGSSVCAIIGFLFCLRLWSVRPYWLNQILKDIRRSLKKVEILKIVNSVIQMIGAFPRRVRAFCSAFLRQCFLTVNGLTDSTIPDADNLIGPVKPDSNLQLVLDSFPTIVGSGSEPYGIHHKKIEETWQSMHPKTKLCPLRDCYKDLEEISFQDVLKFDISQEDSLQDYIEMWRKLSQKPFKDITKTLNTVKAMPAYKGDAPLKGSQKISHVKDVVEYAQISRAGQGEAIRRDVQCSSNGK